MKNNIVLIMSRLGFGGAERVAVSFCNWIVENTNDKVTILKFDNDDSAYELDDRVNVINFEKNSSNRVMAIINRYRFCKKNLKKLNANLVFAMFYQTELYAYFSKPCNCKVIGSERCNVLELSNLKKHITYYAAKKCDGFIFQTEGIKKTFPIKVQKNSIVISNAISNKKVYDINVHNKENVITAMGRLNSQKGFDTLIKAFSIVNKKNSSYTLKIFGEGPDRDTLQNLIDTAGLHDYVQLCGAKSDAINDVANSKIFVLSSRYEGMPNALIEAMAAGTACISTDCKFGPSELISDGKNGLLTPVDDVRTLSEKNIILNRK
ncbi:MAG: glycosyltransferase [Bacilli bacterium]